MLVGLALGALFIKLSVHHIKERFRLKDHEQVYASSLVIQVEFHT